jgi:hypothetical protein
MDRFMKYCLFQMMMRYTVAGHFRIGNDLAGPGMKGGERCNLLDVRRGTLSPLP